MIHIKMLPFYDAVLIVLAGKTSQEFVSTFPVSFTRVCMPHDYSVYMSLIFLESLYGNDLSNSNSQDSFLSQKRVFKYS